MIAKFLVFLVHIHGTSTSKCLLWLWIHRAKLLCCSFQSGCQQSSHFAAPCWGYYVKQYQHIPCSLSQPAPLLPSYMKECPILHERATNREVHSVLTLPTLWSYFLRHSTCHLSVVSRGKTPLSGDKQGALTGTWQKTRGEENPCCQDKWKKKKKKKSCPQFCSLSSSGSESTGPLGAGFSLKSWPLANLMGNIRQSKEGMFWKTPSNPTEVSPNGMNSSLGSQKEAQG